MLHIYIYIYINVDSWLLPWLACQPDLPFAIRDDPSSTQEKDMDFFSAPKNMEIEVARTERTSVAAVVFVSRKFRPNFLDGLFDRRIA